MTRNVLAVLLLLTGLAFVGAAFEARKQERIAEVWRRMYLAAEKDAKYKRCIDGDDGYVICERPKPE